jgi:NAD+ synthase (glutamine-hydrolysing)
MAKAFVEDDLVVDLDAPAKKELPLEEGIHHLYQALVMGVRDYFVKQGFTKAILGLSGGIDSALVACIAVDALGASNVSALALPTRFSSEASHTDAALLAKNLHLPLQLISIEKTFEHYLHLLDPFIKKGSCSLMEENLQSRIRGMILMAFSNAQGSLLLTTGNKSEMAMGYATLYGDMCGGLGPLFDVTKLRVYELACYVNRAQEIIPNSILKKAPSAELKPNQTDQDTLPPYEVLDPIIEALIEQGLSPKEAAEQQEVSLELVEHIVRAIHRAEYKRRQAPLGLRVTQKAFGCGRHVPVVQGWD